MSSPQEQHIATYREEAGELLAELETSLLELEDNPQDNDLINRVFRAMHTIKGSGAMFGFDDIARFTMRWKRSLTRSETARCRLPAVCSI